MRFRKGTKVEVLTQKEVPSGSWRCAEIIGGNGHNYTVRYDGDNMGGLGEQEATLVERVFRKAIRPCPPSVDVFWENWVVGDVVEVFHNFSWKMATVLKVLGWTHLVVRLLGSGIELKVSKHDVRARLCWQDGEWMVIGKASSKCEDLKLRLPSSRKESVKLDDPITRRHITDNKCVLDSQGVPQGRTLKRKQSHPDSHTEADPRRAHKIRLGKKKEKIWHPPVNVKLQQPQLPEKVDDVASLHLRPEKFVRPFTLKTLNGGLGCSRSSICLEPENGDDFSVTSSVGSCSVIHRDRPHHHNNLHYIHNNGAGPLEEDNDNNNSECSSDAESFCGLRPSQEEIHRLELHAYRRIIEALHASGPLSWDQELLLTNLRDSLHISNDEHLREIRSLVSSSSPCIPC